MKAVTIIVVTLVVWRPAATTFHTVAFAGEMLPGPHPNEEAPAVADGGLLSDRESLCGRS